MNSTYSNHSVLSAPIELASRFSGLNTDHPYRTKFMRDRDRILYSKAFRTLSGKTQVYISGTGDHRRTRLTHTLEVSQIARTIAKGLNLDIELTEAIALGHDIGHTPFGHAGERILHEIVSPLQTIDAQVPKKTIIHELSNEDINKYMNEYGFKHNMQSVRAAIRLESNYGSNGLDLTNYTLWGIQNHSSEKYKEGKVSTKHLTVDFYKQYEQYFYIDKINKKVAWSFEAFVVKEADEIAQRHHDLEDAIRSDAISRAEVCQIMKSNLRILMNNDDRDRLVKMKDRKTDEETFIAYMSRIVVNTLVNKLINSSGKNLDTLISQYNVNNSNTTDFFKDHSHSDNMINSAINYITYEEQKEKHNKISESITNFRDVMTERILNSYDVQRLDSKGKYIIRKLFEAYYTNPQQLPDYVIEIYLLDVEEYKTHDSIQQIILQKGMGFVRSKFVTYHFKHSTDYNSQIKLMRVICDHIAGMTDSIAISEYKKLYG